jgi:Uma2 family endonuclease
MSSRAKKLLTPHEYLAIERRAEYKSEYFGGEMFALAGANKRHNLIVANVVRVLGNQLLDRDCSVYPSDLRVRVNATGMYTYPDVTVACGEEQFEDDLNDTLLNPVVIIEVLPESTEAYDRGKKFEHYQSIGSLSDYLLIAQLPRRIEQFVRQDDSTWTYRAYHGVDDIVRLATIGCGLRLEDVYAKVT